MLFDAGVGASVPPGILAVLGNAAHTAGFGGTANVKAEMIMRYNTMRFRPFLNSATLKFSNSPTWQPDSFR